eukprot:GILK01000381.1.p1 GENE.GILK01000381.1~~GILK01000381.1.p1  ORF type:complete len:547 (-),score=106.19 GILK01000381.1:136-1701(-)
MASTNVSGPFSVHSDAVTTDDKHIVSEFNYQTTLVEKKADGAVHVTPVSRKYTFKTEKKVPRTGLMLIGWGGNNGSTVTAGIIANREKMSWRSAKGTVRQADYVGSITQSSTVRLGTDAQGNDVFIPLKDLLPMVNPNDIVVGGWDISNVNLADAMTRAEVLDWDLQRQLRPHMENLVPLPAIYYPDFIAANQADRANNLLPGTKAEQLAAVRQQIRTFKAQNQLDKIIVLWTANTERFAAIVPGVNDTADNLLAAIERGEDEISPSTIYATACMLEKTPYINGSPQNTFVPGLMELAERENVHIGGDDFKSGQTKLKSVLVDFLVSAGIKPTSIVSYNHLGNNDGKNLNEYKQFRSKEISKSNVVDDMVNSNSILYKEGEKPDHCVVIKYIPYVGDSKRALDEYMSEIFLGGKNTLAIHNTCEDSLLASPLIYDLAILTELMTRITYKTDATADFESFHPVLSILSYLLKAPLVPRGTPVVNALFRQKAAIENLFRVCAGLPVDNNMLLEHKTKFGSFSA